MDSRRGGMTGEEIRQLAVELVSLLPQVEGGCRLTDEQQRAVVDLITTKKRVVRWTLYLVGAMILWVLKDVYLYIVNHIVFGWGR